jgi:acyl dehydratase
MKYLEDFPLGERRKLGTTSLSEADVVRFATEFDPQPFHVDAGAAGASIYGGLIASGWHTCALTMRVLVDGFLADSASMGSPGIDELRWLKPVRPGDTLTVYGTVVEVQLSKSKPDRGFLHNLTEVENQAGDVVMSMRGKTMIKRRDAGASVATSEAAAP